MARILLVEDDRSVAQGITAWLTRDMHTVQAVEDGETAIDWLKGHQYDLLILDLTLPGVGGLDVLQYYRGQGGLSPVMILTGERALATKLSGFGHGADDYLTKPFHVEELTMRVQALLRRPPLQYIDSLKVGDLELATKGRLAKFKDQPLKLDPIEFALLEFLMRNPGQVFSGEELAARAWPPDATPTPATVTTCVKRLRDKVSQATADGSGKSLIRTVYGAGYCLDKVND